MSVETAPPTRTSTEGSLTYAELAKDPSIDPLIRAHSLRLAEEASGDILVNNEIDKTNPESKDEKLVPNLSEELKELADKSIDFQQRYKSLIDQELQLKKEYDSKVSILRSNIDSKDYSDRQKKREFDEGYQAIRKKNILCRIKSR